MPDDFSIQFDVRGDPEAYQVVRTGLDTYNLNFIPSVEHTPLNLYVRAHDGTVLGGLLGGTIWGWLYVEILWLAEPLRGHGLGSCLLAQAEAEAVRRGCLLARLDTIDFQALPFYQKHGYVIFGVLEDWPIGHRSFSLRKNLA